MQWETAKTFCHTRVHDKERCSPHLPRVFDTLSQFEPCICKKYSFSLPPLAVQIAVDIQPPDFFPRRRSQWSLVTSPCFHSTWRGQQHEETKGIWRTPRPFVEKYLHLFTLMTYLQYIQELLYNYASAEALRVVKEQKKHQNSRGHKWRPRLCNMRSPKKILVTFSPHIRMSRKLLRQ